MSQGFSQMDVGSEFLSVSPVIWVPPGAGTLYHSQMEVSHCSGLPRTFSHQDVKVRLAAGMRRPPKGLYKGLLWGQKT